MRTRSIVALVLAAKRDEQKLSRVTFPFWLLRMNDSPIDIFPDAGEEAALAVSLTVDDLKRYGPALLLDHTEDGKQLLVWTE